MAFTVSCKSCSEMATPAVQQRIAQTIGQLLGRGVVQVQLTFAGAPNVERSVSSMICRFGVQFLLVGDLGADQNFRLAGDLLHRDFAADLAAQGAADLLAPEVPD